MVLLPILIAGSILPSACVNLTPLSTLLGPPPRSAPPIFRARAECPHAPSKPAILLVPNLGWWVIGAMAKEIAKAGSQQFDFYLLTESLLAKRPDLVAMADFPYGFGTCAQ